NIFHAVIKLSFPLSAERCARLGLGTFRNRAKEIFKKYSTFYSKIKKKQNQKKINKSRKYIETPT
ncbi:hypothetical protein M5D96_008240, partial [Drosophila gunungcola]